MFMTPNQLYNHIETIYNHFDDFKSKMLIDNFLIIKRDSYYQGFISVTDNTKLQFKISKLEEREYHTTHYELQYEIIENPATSPKKFACSDEFMTKIPQSFLNLFNPTLREFKIKMVMNNKEDSTQTIFEHSI